MKKFNSSPKASPFLLIVLFVFAASSASAQWGFWGKANKGNGNVTTETRQVGNFDEISTSAAITIYYTQGPKSVKVETDENLQDFIITEVKGNRLIVRRKNYTKIKKSTKMNVYVSSPNLYAVSASSASKFICKEKISTSNMRINTSSAASAELSVSAKKVTIDSSSASSLNATINAETINIDVSSAASINIDGQANYGNFDASSSGSINAKNLSVKHCDAGASSAGSIDITVTQSIDGHASSAGSVDYWGQPTEVNRSTSSGGSVSSR